MSRARKGTSGKSGISRRTFNKAVLGTGAALAMGNVFPGCSRSDSPPPSTVQTETQTLHFDLSGHPADSTHVLRVGGKRYTLVPQSPLLTNGIGTYTHHAADVKLSAEKPQLFSVTSVHPQRGNGLSVVAFYIPSAARAKVQAAIRKQTAKRACTQADDECAQMDQFPDQFITVFDTAKAIVMHHPEIINLNSDIAAQVEVHIGNSYDNGEMKNFAQSICDQGPAYEHDPTGYWKDGWAVLVPLKNADGTPMLDKSTPPKQVYDYQFSDRTSRDLKPAVRDVLSRIKNDPALKDKMYSVRTHGATDSASLVDKLVTRYRLLKAGGVQVTATKSGYHDNVLFKNLAYTGSGSTRSFTMDIVNMNFIWYGIYLEYLDAAGKAIKVPSTGLMLSDLDSEYLRLEWLESDTVKWETIISSPPTIFGVPLYPYPTELNITLPEGASSVRVMLCGPGAFGGVDYSPSLNVGIVMTALLQYALPTYFIVSAKGIDEDASLWNTFTGKVVMMKMVLTIFSALEEIINPSASHKAAVTGSVESLLASMLQRMITLILQGALPKITEWAVEKTSEEEAEDAIPFLGWVIRIVTLLGSVADIVTTTAELATNPLVIENTVSFTATVDVTVKCDPGNYQFPEEANYYEVQFIVSGATYPSSAPQGFTLDVSDRGSRSFRVSVDGVPTTGKDDDAVEIWFYSDAKKSWLAGHGKAAFTNAPAVDGSVTATVTIEENVIPLTATTVYSQHRKLEYLGGKYVWNENPATLQAPVIEATDCGAGLCELTNISVWVPGGMLGYSWATAGQHVVKNVNAQEADPNPGMKTLMSGTGAPTPVAYDKTAPYTTANMNGMHFYLDPVDISVDTPAYYLRRLCLDPANGLFKTTESWGRFPMQLDRLAVHPAGYVVGISTNTHKMGVLKLPDQAYASDDNTNNAVLKLGYGTNSQFVQKPQALTISRTGAILILEGESAMSIKAFDTVGNPWPFFNNGTASSFPLSETDAKWLDIAIDDTEMIFILSYTGTGMLKSDYRLDVYDKTGNRVFRNTGIAVARMIVDKWRRLYSLNQETMKNSPIVEPTVSVWMPSLPAK